jgi:hypothetical protein
MKQSTGQPVKPADQSDDELKMLAIQGLMNSDPERTLPLLEKMINGSGLAKGKIKGALRAGAKVAAGARDFGQNRVRPDQPGPAAQGG